MEGHYATPRSVLAKLDSVIAEFSSSDEEQHNNNGVYMTMKDLSLALSKEKPQSASTDDKLPTILTIKENSRSPQVTEDSPLKPTVPPRKIKTEKTPKISCLSVVQLSIILDKITDHTELQEMDFVLPQNDFTNCLTLTEASGFICVSKWNDPHHLGCIFHQGDYVVAMNDMQVMNMDEISLFTSRSTRKEVKLTIHRLPDSDILHARGCKCS
ncbi:pleckstrin homology domain-containing family S member 1 [Sceloporus undulatus]|uniref:pleckstrin homology domain-containing family S member 1 n=1 Tax=Sceloporus undulatus TaxID=8520 RepID=UPI001C4CE20A|nr:pleckstrin homology domain-containing family S member 1 [Sceloporus undulatus]